MRLIWLVIPLVLIGMFAISFIGIFPNALAESDELNVQYLQIKKVYDDQRWNLEKEFEKKFEESSLYYKEQKQIIYDKSTSDPTLSDTEINKMLTDLFVVFVEKQDDIKTEFNSRLEALDTMFSVKFEQIDNEFKPTTKSFVNIDLKYDKPPTKEILMYLENDVRKIYYAGENINSAFFNHDTWSATFELGENATLDIKAPQVYKIGGFLFVLINGEEVDANVSSDDCFYYASFETKTPEKLEIIFAHWPEDPERTDNCETFVVSPLKQFKLGVSLDKITCKDEYVIITRHDGRPICVSYSTGEKILQRGAGVCPDMVVGRGHPCGFHSAPDGNSESGYDSVTSSIPLRGLPVIDNAEMQSMIDLFENIYDTSHTTFVGPYIILNATNVWGETISLIMQSLDGKVNATLTCNHTDWRNQEVITENVMDYLKNNNCFNPVLEESRK